MKKSRLIQIIKEEVQLRLFEFGMEQPYFTPAGFEQMNVPREKRIQRFTDPEKWRIIAMQLGAVVRDRGDDRIAVLPNGKILGTFAKMTQIGTLSL
jgi:hypothetical protein